MINPYRCIEVWRISITQASHPPTYISDHEFLDCEETLQILQIMLVEQADSDQMTLLTPMSSFGPPDMAGVVMPVPIGQPVITSQVPTQTATNISVNVTNPLDNGTNQGACGCLTSHEWVWFWLEGQAGCNLGPAWTECRSLPHCGCGMGSSKIAQNGMVDG